MFVKLLTLLGVVSVLSFFVWLTTLPGLDRGRSDEALGRVLIRVSIACAIATAVVAAFGLVFL